MTRTTVARGLAVLTLGISTSVAVAAQIDIDTTNSQNGVFDIYSATFDPALTPCVVGSPSYCAFFHGNPPATRALVITPNPTTTTTGIPGGIGPPTPASASFLDLTLGAGNTSVTLSGGSIKLPVLIVTISGTTVVTATGAGFVFGSAPQTTAVDADGRAEFLVDLTPATAVDFSTFSIVVTSCTGPQCPLIPLLTLDMIRYRLVVDYDPSFGSFTGSLIGQTANNSMLFATLNSGVPEIAVTDSQPPANDLDVPFGDVTELTSAIRTITVANAGGGSLILGNIAQVATPFAIANDTCSGHTLLLAASCTFDVTFSPGFVGPFNDTLAIPSNDSNENPVTVAISGAGVAAPVPNIVVTDSVAPNADLAVPFGNVLTGGQADQTVSVTNAGTAALDLGPVAMADALLAPFSIQTDTCSNRTLLPTEACSLGVRFEPTALGPFADSLDIPSNDADTPTVTLNVSGTGTPIAVPDIRITDPVAPDDDRHMSFDNVRESDSFDRTIRIANIGDLDLVLGDMGQVDPLAAPFSIVAGEDDCSGQTLAPSASCTVRLRFAPTAIADFNDTFDVPSNDPDEPSVIVAVDGSGVAAPVDNAESGPNGASSGFMAIDPATLLVLVLFGIVRNRRLRTRPAR